jgi:hypothetical protein
MIEAVEKRPKELVFTLKPEKAQVAKEILEEAQKFNGKVDQFRLTFPNRIPERHSLIDDPIDGLTELRQAARNSVLLANGTEANDLHISYQMRKIKEETFERRDSSSFLVWKGFNGKTFASGDLGYMRTPLVDKLIGIGKTNRGWENLVCWSLGRPELYFDEANERFKRIKPEIPFFLFSDELEELKNKGELLSYIYQDLYEEMFEAYMIGKNPEYNWPALYKVRGYLMD